MNSFVFNCAKLVIIVLYFTIALLYPTHCKADDTFNLIELKKYATNPEFSPKNFKIFDNINFIKALNKTTSKTIAKTFLQEYKSGGRYFQMTKFKSEGNILQIDMQNLAGESFESSFYINPDSNYMDVCWNAWDQKENRGRTTFFLHDGKKIVLATPETSQCSSTDYKRVINPDLNAKLSNEEKQKLIGTWSAAEKDIISNKRIEVLLQIKEDPSTHKLQFHQKRVLTTPQGVFKCNGKNTLTQMTDGDAEIDYGKVLFHEATVSTPACGKPDSYSMEFQGDKLFGILEMQTFKLSKQVQP